MKLEDKIAVQCSTLEEMNKASAFVLGKPVEFEKHHLESFSCITLQSGLCQNLEYFNNGKYKILSFGEFERIYLNKSLEAAPYTYGLRIGDSLPAEVICQWAGHGFNVTNNQSTWEKRRGFFSGDRSIKGFQHIDGHLGFLVSGTGEVYLKAEGFKQFCEQQTQVKKPEPAPLTQQQLLAEAKRRFPPGTKHTGYSHLYKQPAEYPYTVKGEVYFSGGNIYSACAGIIYSGDYKVWAKIDPTCIAQVPNSPPELKNDVRTKALEIAKEAKERYPIGTKVRCLTVGGAISTIVRQEHSLYRDGIKIDAYDKIDIWYTSDTGGILVYRDGKWAECHSSTAFEDILAEAKRRYPIGSQVRCLSNNALYTIDNNFHPVCNEKEFFKSGEIWFVATTGYGIKVYHKGKWADLAIADIKSAVTRWKEFDYQDQKYSQSFKQDHASSEPELDQPILLKNKKKKLKLIQL